VLSPLLGKDVVLERELVCIRISNFSPFSIECCMYRDLSFEQKRKTTLCDV
jgi:hypothetical protein